MGALRLTVLERGAPLIEDVIVSGHDRDELALLVFVSRAHVKRARANGAIFGAASSHRARVIDLVAAAAA